MYKKALSAALAAAMAMGCVACGNTSSVEGTTSTDNASTGDESITITMLDQFVDSDAISGPYHARLEAFQEAHPNVKFEIETLSASDMASKVLTLAAADELPDIFLLKGQMAESFAKNGYAMDLTDFLNDNPEWVSGFRDGVFSNFEIDGGTYAIPYTVTNTLIVYNTDLFEQAGIEEFPTTWDGLIETCNQLNAAGITPIVLGNSSLWPAESVIMSILGNRCTGDEWYESLRNNTGSKFTDDEFVLALQSLYDLAAAGAFNSDVNSIDPDAQRAAFMNGQAAMMFEGSWGIPILDANMDETMKSSVKLAVMPTVEGGKGEPGVITGGSGWGFAVNAKLDESKRELVEEFLMTVVGTEFATDCISKGLVPPYKTDEYTLDDSSVIAKQYFEFIEGRSYVPVYDHQLSSGLMDVMQSGLQEILNNTKTPESLAQELQDQYEMENG